jgi:molecular chaperone HscB
MPTGFDVDRDRLEEAYRDRQRQFHPDRFATRSERERRFAMERVTVLNEAYQTLKDPLARAKYLLEQAGYGGDEKDRGAAPADTAFLMEVMEQREALEAITLSDPDAQARLDALRHEMETAIQTEETALSHAFSDHAQTGSVAALAHVARHVDRLRYHQRFLEEVDRLEERLLDAS